MIEMNEKMVPCKTDGNISNRIVHVIYSGLGGHSAVMFSLLEAGFLAEGKHHVVLAGIENPPREYLDRLDVLGVSWSYIRKEEGRAHLDFYKRLRMAIFYESDVIFLHGVAAIPAVAMMLGRRGNGPLVLLRETEPTQVKTRRVWAMLALAHICTDAVVHLTVEAASDARAKLRFLHRPAKLHVISNGLDTEFFSRAAASRIPDGVLRIGMQSRLQPTKDHLTLIDAFARLCAARPGQKLELHIAGDGPTRPQIEARITALGLDGSVTLHGMLGREEVRDFLRGLNTYVHSSFGETQSNAILQATSTGLRVVASDVPGISNMIRPGLGLLHISADADDLAARIGELIDAPQQAATLGKAARAEATSAYSAQASARAWEKLVSELHGGFA